MSSKVSRKSLRSLMHLRSTQVLNHQMVRYYLMRLCCFFFSSPLNNTRGLLAAGNASLSPPPSFLCLPCRVTDGFSCRQTITAAAFGRIPFVSGSGNKIVVWKWSCCFFVLCVVHIRKEYSLYKFSLRGGRSLTWRDVFLKIISMWVCFFECSWRICQTRCSAVRQSVRAA